MTATRRTARSVGPTSHGSRPTTAVRLLASALMVLTFAGPAQAAGGVIRRDECEGPDRTWVLTAGEMRWHNGTCIPEAGQFRMHTSASYGDASMTVRFYLRGWNTKRPYLSPATTTGVPLRGIRVIARWRSRDSLYYIAVERSAEYGEELLVEKKRPIPGCVPQTAVQCGTYHTLGRFPNVTPERLGWHTVKVAAADSADGVSVRLRVWYDGLFAGTVWDDGTIGRPALRGSAPFGWRSDNAYSRIDWVVWSPASAAPARP